MLAARRNSVKTACGIALEAGKIPQPPCQARAGVMLTQKPVHE
jgi:hypothetical protein